MTAEQIWLTLLTLAVAALALAFVRAGQRAPRAAEAPSAASEGWRREAESLERRLSERLDGVLSLVTAQNSLAVLLAASRPAAAAESARSVPSSGEEPQEPPAPASREKESPVLQEPRGPAGYAPRFERSPADVSSNLEVLLGDQRFRREVWSRLDGEFFACKGVILGHLRASGMGEAEIAIDPYPSLRDGNPNHWVFMSIAPRSRREGARRFLLPRHFMRYDPSFHSYLFELRGRGDDLEMFIRRLHRCAIVKAEASPVEEIGPGDVLQQGEISVTEGEVW
jgi:hypothetical protein